MEDTVKLIFSGQLQPGRELAEVKAGLPDVMKIPLDHVERLFTGKPVVIKRGLPVSKLPAYQDLLRKAGLQIVVENEPNEHVLDLEPLAETDSTPIAATALPIEEITCPQCGATQPKRTLCRECGVDMPRFTAAQEVLRTEARSAAPVNIQAAYAAAAMLPDEDLPPIFGFSFDGRLNRMRYLIYALAAYVVMILTGLIVAGSMFHSMFRGDFPVFSVLLMVVVVLAMAFLGFRYSAQRLHDMGLSGWLVLLSFVPLLGGLVWLWLSVWPGNRETNEYGAPNPPNSVIHQAIVLGLALLLVLLVGIGFQKAMRMQSDMTINRTMPMQVTPNAYDEEALQRERL